MNPRPSGLGALNVALVLSMFVLAGVILFVFARPDPFDPLTFSPTPRPVERPERTDDGDLVRVVPSIEGFDGPAVRVDEKVPTTGLLCNEHPEPVEVLGHITWERWDERGQRIPTLVDHPAIVEPDCTPLRFENPIPDEIAAQVKAHGPQQWVISGSATPTAPGGVTATWRIEPFWIVP